jgi:hypothetical protein
MRPCSALASVGPADQPMTQRPAASAEGAGYWTG